MTMTAGSGTNETNMDELKPQIRILLRIIQILVKEEQEQAVHEQASRYYRRQNRETDDRRKYRPTSKDRNEDEDEKERHSNRRERRDSNDVERTSSRERRSRRDTAMLRGRSADGRGRTPSPKRFPAPKPPSRDCPSPIPKMVSTADVTPVDQQGWLIDQLRGKKVWCVISDMLFCVFEKEDSKVSKQVILLPGCTVRPIEFKSASQEGKVLNGVARHFATTKTISGVDKYQFLIDNNINRQKSMFGVASKSELDNWISALERACCVDMATEQNENEKDVEVKKSKSKLIIRRNKSNSPRNNYYSEDKSANTSSSTYSPAQTLPSRLDMMSFALPVNNSHDVSKDTIDDIRKRLRKDNSEPDFKHIPMKVKHSPESSEISESTGTELNSNSYSTSGKGWGFLKAPLGLLRRKKRSSSADDAYRRRKMFPIREPDTISNPGLSPRLSGSQPSLASSMDSSTSCSNHDASFASSTDSKDSNKSKKRGFLSRSFDSDKSSSSKSTRSSFRKSASELKDKIFGKHDSTDPQSPRSRSAGINLKDIENPSVSGYLQYRLAFKWTKVWCVLSRGCFYAFRTQKGEEFPVLALVLNQSSVSYVMDTDKHGKKLFAFKITPRHCKSVYICADDYDILMLWMKDLQTEAVKVQVDETLAIEIQEKRSSQKKREIRESKEKEAKEKLDAKRQELKQKRYSCPDINLRQDKEIGDDNNKNISSKNDLNMVRKNVNVYMGDVTIDSGQNTLEKERKMVISEGTNGANSDKIDSKNTTDFLSNSKESRSSQNISKNPKGTQSLSRGTGSQFKDNFTGKNNVFFNNVLNREKDINGNTSHDTTTTQQSNRHHKFPIQRSNSLTKEIRLWRAKQHQEEQQQKQEHMTSFTIFSSQPNFTSNSSTKAATSQNNDDLELSSNHASSTSSDISPSPTAALTSISNVNHDHTKIAKYATHDINLSSNETTLLEEPRVNEDQNQTMDNGIPIEDPLNDIQESVVESLLYDDALKYTWSADEDFLLGVIKDKLRKRRERIESGDNGVVNPDKDINWQESMIVYDGDGYDTGMNSEVISPRDLTTTDYAEDEDVFCSPGQDEATEDNFMEGFLEKKVDGRWIKHWCSLKDGCLCFYITPNDQISADSTDLTGYRTEQLVDNFRGKRFVLSLTHPDYVDILLSLDSRDELEVWHQSVSDIITAKTKRHQNGMKGSSDKSSLPSQDANGKKEMTPSAENVKHKLLAEMLRQKMELQKMRAARNGSRMRSNPDQPTDGSYSPQPSPDSLDERVRTMTRLRQRRMSTQIKMTAIQKKIEESSSPTKEKKAVFQLVRRKPDLVQSHSLDLSHQSELEQEVKRLSSQLQEIDTSISSHEVRTRSPRDDAAGAKNRFRHSCDSSLLKMAITQANEEVQLRKSMGETPADYDNNNKKKKDEKEKRKEKDVTRSNSIKNSMQQFAHRTFARAHWNKFRKQNNKSPFSKNEDNNTINENDDNSSYSSNDNNFGTREKPPDVIDVTSNNNNNSNGSEFSPQDWNIYAPPDSFRTDDSNIARDQTATPTKKHRTPKERILSKLTSHSFTQSDKKSSRLKPSSSSPSLLKLLSKPDNKKDNENDSISELQNSPGESPSSIPKLNLNFDRDEIDSSVLSSDRSSSHSNNDNYNSKHNNLYSQSSRGDYGSGNSHSNSHNTLLFYSARGSHEMPESSSGSESPRKDRTRVRSGFYSARTERTSPNPNRNSWSYSVMGSARRQEVNPNALAEIKAFEELSSKFLGIEDN